MTKLIELFEDIIYDNPYDTHGFIEVKEVKNCHSGDLEEMVTKIIKENGSDALIAFQRGVKYGKIDLLIPDFDFGEDIFVCLFQIDEYYGVKEECMGVFTKEQMEQYLEKYIEQTMKQKFYGLLDEIQEVMEAKNLNEVNIELFEDSNFEKTVFYLTALSIKTIDGEMVAKFNYDCGEENHNFTVTKCNGEQEIDSITEVYEIFTYAFRFGKWEEFIEPLEIWIKQNKE
jgi:hypothetical protein